MSLPQTRQATVMANLSVVGGQCHDTGWLGSNCLYKYGIHLTPSSPRAVDSKVSNRPGRAKGTGTNV